jgi:hypothetical protein
VAQADASARARTQSFREPSRNPSAFAVSAMILPLFCAGSRPPSKP